MFILNRVILKGLVVKGWGNCGIEKGEYLFKLWFDMYVLYKFIMFI